MPTANSLLDDRQVDFVLRDVLDAGGLCRLPAFREHGWETFEGYLSSARKLAREVLFPGYRAMDEAPPVLVEGEVRVHPLMRAQLSALAGLGVIAATRPAEVGGHALPQLVAAAAHLYPMAGNLSVAACAGLTSGAAHLVESFGDRELRDRYLPPMHDGSWTGTMALTEPQAGSSLADVATRARPGPDRAYLLQGAKTFISGGDHDAAENIVHLVLARIEGAPAGVRGLSLFVVPKLRPEGGRLVQNDVRVTGLIHKIGWRGLPSVALALGEEDDCRGWRVGEAGQGLAHMFQMMNAARIMVGCHGVATASVAYLESLRYAQERLQGRPLGSRDPLRAQVPIIEHADVRRMLLRQKVIVEGGMTLVLAAARQADLAEHATGEDERGRARLLLDLLTPSAKSYPAEAGYTSNALAVQIHGGYGYSSEYLPEAWLRDQKLNSIHEGTTTIQGLDLLGRRAVAGGGAAMRAFAEEVESAVERARRAGVEPRFGEALARALSLVGEVTLARAAEGLAGDAEAMLRHSADYLEAFSLVAVGWCWLLQAAAAEERAAHPSAGDAERAFLEGKRCAAQSFFATDLPRVNGLVELVRTGEDSYARMRPEWF